MVQHRISIHHRNSAARLAVVTIPIKLDWVNEGKVVTETFTDFKEINDDSDASGFGSGFDSKFSSFPDFDSSFKTSSSKALQSSSTSPFKKSNLSTKSSSSSSSSSEDEDDFEEDALKKHNEYRQKHGCPPLKLDKKLCKYAQEWADKLAKENRFDHRSNSQYGENLYCSWSSNPKKGVSGDKAVESWYDEIKQHQFGTEPRSMGTGHFTQVVWKNSKHLGIAKARSSSGKIIVVANYEPAGNFIGQYVQNVPAPKN